MIVFLLSFLVVFLFFILWFINANPVFGRNPNKEQKKEYSQLGNYVDGKFVNPVPTKSDMSTADYYSMLKEHISGAKDRNPKRSNSCFQVGLEQNQKCGRQFNLVWTFCFFT